MPEQFITSSREAWTILSGLVVFVGWLTRLEWRGRQNDEELKRMEKRLTRQRDEDQQRRHEDWEHVNRRLDEVGRDIKTLLQRGN